MRSRCLRSWRKKASKGSRARRDIAGHTTLTLLVNALAIEQTPEEEMGIDTIVYSRIAFSAVMLFMLSTVLPNSLFLSFIHTSARARCACSATEPVQISRIT